MIAIGLLFARMVRDFFKPRLRLEAEILILRHQLNVLERRTPRRRLHLRWIDRVLFIWLYRRYPRILDALSIVRPEKAMLHLAELWHSRCRDCNWLKHPVASRSAAERSCQRWELDSD